jgi:hypothetical protein
MTKKNPTHTHITTIALQDQRITRRTYYYRSKLRMSSNISDISSPLTRENDPRSPSREVEDNTIIPTPDTNTIIPRRSHRFPHPIGMMTQSMIGSTFPFLPNLHTEGQPSNITISDGDVFPEPTISSSSTVPEEHRPEHTEQAEILEPPSPKRKKRTRSPDREYDIFEQICKIIHDVSKYGCPRPFDLEMVEHPDDTKITFICSSEEISLRIQIQN